MVPTKVLLLVGSLFLSVAAQNTQTEFECPPCADGLDPFTFDLPRGDDISCQDLVENAARLTDGSEQCRENQLGTFQLGCCDSPPAQMCTLCPDGRLNFDETKAIPRGVSETIIFNCDSVSVSDRFVKDYISAPGDCQSTLRSRSGAWCGCTDVVPSCELICGDGNPPPDLSLVDPVFGKTCARHQYEYSLLTNSECDRASTVLGFDAASFCCPDLDPVDGCSICPFGQKLVDSSVTVTTEFAGEVTCGEIEEYARYLPETDNACAIFFFELDVREGDACCERDPSITFSPTPSSAATGGIRRCSFGSTLVLSCWWFTFLLIVPARVRE